MIFEKTINEAGGSRQEKTTNIAQRIFDSIPETGSNPETSKLSEELKDVLFSPEYLSELRIMGVGVEKVFTGVSRNKVEIFLVIKLISGERQIVVRFENGKTGSIRITSGVSDGEKILKEEVLPETLDKTIIRTRKIVDELLTQ